MVARKRRRLSVAEQAADWKTSCVVDASVAVKWYTREAGSVQASELVRSIAEGRCQAHAPEWLVIEVLNALRWKRLITEQETGHCLDDLLGTGIQFHAMSADLSRRALACSWRHGLTMYDASYVALAETLRAPLVTADGGILKSLGPTGLAIPL